MLMPTKILVPTDFSGYSDKALNQAFDIAKDYKAKVYLVHVVHERISHSLDDYELTPQSNQEYGNKDGKRGQEEITETD
jgi:nucleotide-binding universal stress UspA family protein